MLNPRKKIELELLFIISEMHNRTVCSMNEETHLYCDLTFDSLDMAELIIEIERKWKFDLIKNTDMKKVKRIKHLLDAIEHHQNSKTKTAEKPTKNSIATTVG